MLPTGHCRLLLTGRWTMLPERAMDDAAGCLLIVMLATNLHISKLPNACEWLSIVVCFCRSNCSCTSRSRFRTVVDCSLLVSIQLFLHFLVSFSHCFSPAGIDASHRALLPTDRSLRLIDASKRANVLACAERTKPTLPIVDRATVLRAMCWTSERWAGRASDGPDERAMGQTSERWAGRASDFS